VAIEKIAVLRATARPRLAGGGIASPWASPVAVAVGSLDTPHDATARGGGAGRPRRSGHGPLQSAPLMANIHSQKKRILRAERERIENRRYTSTIRTYFRRLQAALESGETGKAATEHRELVSTIDKAVKRGAMHRNSGARKKSRAARLVAGTDSTAE
jgi:small subunit ribosomal protein S20